MSANAGAAPQPGGREGFLAALTRALEQVAEGDYAVRVETGGDAQLEAVAAAFTGMQARLRDTVRSLELAIRHLHDKQRELVEAEKLASLGRVAAAVAHEINNPLAVMSEKAGLLGDLLERRDDLPARGEYLELLAGVVGQIGRCRSITHRLLGHARRADLEVEEVDLDALVRDVREYLGRAAADRCVRVDLEPGPGLPTVFTDRVQLEEVLVNLVRNAVQAAPPGGGRVVVATGLADDLAARVTIRDNGPGIAPEHQGRIFEPFFTTKERGRGTGLGLFISHGIARRLGGTIAVASAPGSGATFSLTLPLRFCLTGAGVMPSTTEGEDG